MKGRGRGGTGVGKGGVGEGQCQERGRVNGGVGSREGQKTGNGEYYLFFFQNYLPKQSGHHQIKIVLS